MDLEVGKLYTSIKRDWFCADDVPIQRYDANIPIESGQIFLILECVQCRRDPSYHIVRFLANEKLFYIRFVVGSGRWAEIENGRLFVEFGESA